MLLETLKQFDWMNEPQRVRFDDEGMFVSAKQNTDFWCCSRFNFKKDDGHFFYGRAEGDFCCDLNWEFATRGQFNQCGIMLRVDGENWFKASIMYQDEQNPMLATSLTPGPIVVAMEMLFRYWPLTVDGFAFSMAAISAL